MNDESCEYMARQARGARVGLVAGRMVAGTAIRARHRAVDGGECTGRALLAAPFACEFMMVKGEFCLNHKR